MKLPIMISVTHSGLEVPPELEELNLLSRQAIAEDGDEQAAEIYAWSEKVQVYVTTAIARAFVDLNRAENDRRQDGVVKTHTCRLAPIYREPLSEALVKTLLEKYYTPYHQKLSRYTAGVKLGIDCHTMSAVGPPVGPDPDQKRPDICLSNADGTFPQEWLAKLAECLHRAFGAEISLNRPFEGGFIIRSHAGEIPWVQLELSRGPFCSVDEKREKVWQAITEFYQWLQRKEK